MDLNISPFELEGLLGKCWFKSFILQRLKDAYLSQGLSKVTKQSQEEDQTDVAQFRSTSHPQIPEGTVIHVRPTHAFPRACVHKWFCMYWSFSHPNFAEPVPWDQWSTRDVGMNTAHFKPGVVERESWLGAERREARSQWSHRTPWPGALWYSSATYIILSTE